VRAKLNLPHHASDRCQGAIGPTAPSGSPGFLLQRRHRRRRLHRERRLLL